MAEREELETRLLTLEGRVRELEAAEAIRTLKARYGELVDRRYARGRPLPVPELEPIAREIAALFTEDAVWDGGVGLGVCRGREEIRQRFLAPTMHFTWHYFLAPRIRVEGDSASARWDILSPCTTRDERAHWMAGYEEDEYRRVDGRWLHSRMRLSLVFLAPYERGWAGGD